MPEYIEKQAIYQEIAELEELARNRVVDTPSTSPAYVRYVAQLNERTALKHKLFDAPAADVVPVVHGRWVKPVPGDGENYCSACHASQPWFYGYGYFDGNYCPYCGAKMDATAEESEGVNDDAV